MKILVVSLVVLHGLGHLWLEYLSWRWLKKNRGSVPAPFEGRVDAGKVAAAEDYTRARMGLGLWSFLIDKGFIILFLLLDGFAWLSILVEKAGWGAIPSGLLFFGAMALAGKVISLPFEWYETFRLEERFGFNRTTYRTWFADMAKGLVLFLIIGGGLLFSVLFLLYNAGSAWWLVCWAFTFGFSLMMGLLYPVLIAPLFNKFTPIGEGSLKKRVVEMMERAGIRTRGVFVMDAGKRSRHTNAYFTGLGRSKRIVLFDTLMEKHTEDEILAVLAHEAGHWRKKHALKGLLLGQVFSLVLFAVTGWLVAWPPLYSAFGFAAAVPYAGLLLASLVYSPVMFLFKPIFSSLSRCFEYEADRYAGKEMGLAEAMSEGLIRLALENLSNLNPHPAAVFVYYSHPPVADRVTTLRALAD